LYGEKFKKKTNRMNSVKKNKGRGERELKTKEGTGGGTKRFLHRNGNEQFCVLTANQTKSGCRRARKKKKPAILGGGKGEDW